MSELRLLCDDLAIIHGGKLYFQGTTEQFETEMKSDSYEDEFVRLVGGA
jgi:ABC-type Na+ transport system ATPase subunit NatA